MDTRTLRLGGRFTHESDVSAPALVLIEPRDPSISVLESAWSTDPHFPLRQFTDVFGNEGQRLVIPAGRSVFEYSATVLVDDELDPADPSAPQISPDELPDEALSFLWPSRYCQSDLLMGDAWRLFGTKPPDYQRVVDISDYVHGHVAYRVGSTTPDWTALDAFTHGYGVCRDLAHLFVTFCRALNIPARYISGYLPDMDVVPLPTPMDFHAWAQVWLGDRWWTFDPRHNERRKGHVVIAHGRDAADVAMITSFGQPNLTRMVVTCEEAPEHV